MEFLGLTAEDFDFFRKKDKMAKDEYEKNRNNVKLHFRALCYELQKHYHKRTDEVLDINKDFTNFNKRSVNIGAEYGEKTDLVKKVIELNTDNVAIRVLLSASSEDSSKAILEILKNKKQFIWDYIIADKHNQIYCSFIGKGNKVDILKFTSLDMNAKNYDAVIEFIEKNTKNNKASFDLAIQHVCPRNEAIKQSKNLSSVIFEDLLNVKELYLKLS